MDKKEGEIIKGIIMSNLNFINSRDYENDFTLIVEGINTYKYITSTTLEEQERYVKKYKGDKVDFIGEKVDFIITKIEELYHYIRQLNNKEKNEIYNQMVNEIRGFDPYNIYDEEED